MLSKQDTALAQLGMSYEEIETLESHIDTIKELELIDDFSDEEILEEVAAHLGLAAHFLHILKSKYFKLYDIDHTDYLNLCDSWMHDRMHEERTLRLRRLGRE